MVEAQGAVVHTLQSALVHVVADMDVGQDPALGVPQIDDEAVDAMALAPGPGHGRVGRLLVVAGGGVELAEHGRLGGVLRGIADVPLLGHGGRGVDDEFAGGAVVDGGGLKGLDVGAVAALGHAEGAGDAQLHDVLDQRDVAVGAEVLHGTSPQAPLDAGLDHQGEVGAADGLQGGQGGADVLCAAVVLAEGTAG